MPPLGGAGMPLLLPCTDDSLQAAVSRPATAMSNKGLSNFETRIAGPLLFIFSRLFVMTPSTGIVKFRSVLKGPTSLALSINTAAEFRLILCPDSGPLSAVIIPVLDSIGSR